MTDLDTLRRELNEARAEAAALLAVVERFRAEEWAQKADWLGLCPFRRALGCHGTDGHNAPVGPPSPKPHADHCPYAHVATDAGRAALDAVHAAIECLASPEAFVALRAVALRKLRAAFPGVAEK